jgi:hypothetical protein
MNKKNHSNKKVVYIIGQMANFKCGESYYSTKYSSSYIKPTIWWQMVDDPNDYLKSLALKLFSIIPHSVACERTFSMLGFLYGKRRQCLSVSTVEMIAKIRCYLLSDMKNELNHLKKEETESDLKILVQECGFFNDDDDDDDDDDENDDDLNYNNVEVPSHEVHVLIINDMINLSNLAFTGNFEEVMHHNDRFDSSDNDDDDDEILEEEELDFEIIGQILAPQNT